jgi:hypothetical protein
MLLPSRVAAADHCPPLLLLLLLLAVAAAAAAADMNPRYLCPRTG